MDERLAERERIARTLHDTFLQGLQGLMFHLDAVAARLAPASQERAQIENLLDVARKVTDDGRSQVMDLRTDPDHADLGAALAACAEALRMDAHVQVAVEQVGTPRDLTPDARGEVEAIAREAIANAFRHAGAGRIDIRLDWTAPGLVLSVADDGTGMAPRLLARGRPGHWGLRGMRERAARIGASLSLRNRPSGGVEVRLDLGRGKPARRWPGRAWRLFARPDSP
jgi:signal transduction histidine kinase